MARFRKKPVVVEAVQFTQAMYDGGDPLPDGVDGHGADDTGRRLYSVRTLNGRVSISVGEWIITGVKGEKYPCEPDIFERTYEPADGSSEILIRAAEISRACIAAHADEVDLTVDAALEAILSELRRSVEALKDGRFLKGTIVRIAAHVVRPGEDA